MSQLIEEKVCLHCKITKPLTSFSKWKNSTKSHFGYQTWCKECVKTRSKTEHRMNRSRENVRKKRLDPEYREKERQVNKATRERNRIVYLLRAAKDRAIEQGLEFNITKDDLLIPSHCPIFGTKFQMYTWYAASIDRKDSTKGYIPGNVWVISRKANSMKLNATPEELKKFSEYWLNNPVWTK